MAVVKADAYGHGAAAVAERPGRRGRVARRRPGRGGSASCGRPASTRRSWCCRSSRREPNATPWPAALTPSLYTRARTGAAPAAAGRGTAIDVHVKVDTGMHRVGVWPARRSTAAFVRRVIAARVRPGRAVDASSLDPRKTPTRRRISSTDVPDDGRGGSGGRASTRSCSTPRTPRARSCIRRPGSTWSASASGSTASNPRPGVGADLRAATGAQLALDRHDGEASACGRADIATGTGTTWSATRGSPPCRWATRTGTLGRCPREPTS